jgi:Zn-dependent oligopeptidase
MVIDAGRCGGLLGCNFPDPSATAPAEHNDVTTLFHEFGHLIHHPGLQLSG